MKTIKGLGIFTFLALFTGCFSPPEFSSTPAIDFEAIVFKDGASAQEPDTLILSINFRDGDGDLGLTSSETDPPFHSTNYFIENGGDTTELATKTRYSDLPPLIRVPDGAKGKLITYRTRNKEVNGVKVYEGILPPYVYPYKCTNYRYDSIFVSKEDTLIYDKDDHYLDRIMTSSGNPDLYVLKDTFYFETNPNAKNIDVEFWILQNNNTYEKFEIPNNQTTCATISDVFNQRFPHLSDSSSPVEGTLKYNMISAGLIPWFGGKILKLRIRIRDRALNTSNTIETPQFSLDAIRK